MLVRRLQVESLNSIPFAPISEKGIRDRRSPELEASASGKGKVGAREGDDIPTATTFGVGEKSYRESSTY